MINLDSEERGIIYIGCAGGGNTSLNLSLQWESCPDGYCCLDMTVQGLKGGHSGCDIHLGRANAIEVLARLLWNFQEKYDVRIHSFMGGDKHNAIPRTATATIAMPLQQKQKFCNEAQAYFTSVRQEYGPVEPDMALKFIAATGVNKILTREHAEKFLGMVRVLPHGVLAMSPDIPNMVEISNNLARVYLSDGQCNIITSSRSAMKESLEAVREKIAAAACLAGAKVEQLPGYPGWKPNIVSPLLEVVKRNYTKVFGKTPDIRSIHAGLECGVILEKIPDMDMVSIGPQIEHPHSPHERVQISSVSEFWQALKKILTDLAN